MEHAFISPIHLFIFKGRLSSWLPRRRDRGHIATPGVNVKPKHVRGAGNFVMWDMAGQIEYHVTHAMLLGSSRGVFVVVFSMTWSIVKKKEKVTLFHFHDGN